VPLETYREKRDFGKTPEPAGGKTSSHDQPMFVIQKHAASRLHYDLRLEMDGVLRSWAVPKGPSYDTKDRHLAVEVEDHPIEYGDFEGTIPQGEYGGGTVMVWDTGTYEPIGGDATELYRKGDLKFELHGKKLHGRWVLVRMKRRPQEKKDNWLLIKERDESVRPSAEYDVTKAETDSAKTGRTMEQIAAGDDVWESRPKARGKRRPGKAAARAEAVDPSSAAGAAKGPLPPVFEPELTTKVEEAPAGEGWLHEIKLDGYRVLARIDGDDVRFYTRKGLDWTDRFKALVDPVRALGIQSAWLDGEVTVMMPDGRTSFGALQAELKRGAAANLTFHVFDAPYLDGYDLRQSPLVERKRLLGAAMGGATGRVRFLDHVLGSGEAFYQHACEYALEGSIAKKADSPYRSGRGRDWLKLKCLGREDFAVVGYTEPSNGGDGIGSLVLASRSPSGALAYAGRVGTGWNQAESRELRKRLTALGQDGPSLEVPKAEQRGVTWTRPELTVEVAFVEWTSAGIIRHASYEGVREDLLEPPKAPKPDDDTIAGVRLTHPDKMLFGGIGVMKRELATYYDKVAEHMLPHLADRPLVLVRCPEGADGPCFYQKNTETGFPDSVRHVAIRHEEGPVNYALVDSAEGLVSLVQMNVLEIHTWGSRARDVEHPDRLIFDLDPGPDVAWEAVRDGALTVKRVIEELGAAAFVKTTGGKGLHVVMPCEPSLDWQAARDVAKAIAEVVAASDPSAYTTNMRKVQRQGRIFVDYVRNTRGSTAVAAYSTRSKPQAPVSVPVRWDELKAGVRSDGYDIRSVPHRLAALGKDPWEGYDEAAADLAAVKRALP
jgi:bifunctional non-homologous end joining protein LigD